MNAGVFSLYTALPPKPNDNMQNNLHCWKAYSIFFKSHPFKIHEAKCMNKHKHCFIPMFHLFSSQHKSNPLCLQHRWLDISVIFILKRMRDGRVPPYWRSRLSKITCIYKATRSPPFFMQWYRCESCAAQAAMRSLSWGALSTCRSRARYSLLFVWQGQPRDISKTAGRIVLKFRVWY